MVANGWGKEMGELEFNGSRVAFEENENVRIYMVLMVAQQCGMYLIIIIKCQRKSWGQVRTAYLFCAFSK